MSDEVTGILSAIEQGDSHAAEQLLPLVYASWTVRRGATPWRPPPSLHLKAPAP
jgi:hypothetical protein